ncbi:MAG TPA: hypothetical protein VNZ64_12200 [Candidatus Acidoferrum sp.]|jgi:Mrp family chromosome partitioning ATPase/uncharacterized protein involved in exopolysaccharide biosynthesis|nr:hypothetical protein [Candidatus Acidoferrum sp.]
MNLGDVLYILFRHKGKILLISTLGLVAALSLRLIIPRAYQSEAKLYVRYVVESESPTVAAGSDARVRTPESRSETLMSTEVEILYNLSLAQQVAGVIGVEKILGASSSDTNKAAEALLKSLSVEVPRNTSVLHITFKHTNPEIVQPVVERFIESYFKKHAEIHSVGAMDEAFMRELDDRRSRLEQTRDELRKAKEQVGIMSLEDAKRSYDDQLSKIRQQLFDAEADFAERQATVGELSKGLSAMPVAGTNRLVATNYFAAAPAEKLAEYGRVCGLLDTLTRREEELLVTFTPSNSLVQVIQKRIAETEKQKKALEVETPALVSVRVAESKNTVSAVPGLSPGPDLGIEVARLSAAEARVKILKENLAQVRQEMVKLTDAEGKITELQTRQELEEAQYKRFSEKQDQSKTEERMGAGRVLNIGTIQPPSPPLRVVSKLRKMMAMVFLAGIGGAVGLAFLIELYLDPTIKRPQDLGRIQLPLFMSVPVLNGKGKARPLGGKSVPLLAENSGATEQARKAEAKGSGELAPWDPRHELAPFSEALRDRLITWFELKQMTHKPKLVAVTSCGEGAGVSTIAAGLAASLSETGDGNVLLVDMNLESGGAAQFHRGDLACGLDQALEAGKRDQAQVQDKLYMVKETTNSENLPAALPKRFRNLVPRLRASDYDYIIFDMPPVSQISITPRLARFMDIALMVVESEATDREVVKQASALLQQSQANVGVVLNKTQSYVPRALKQDI